MERVDGVVLGAGARCWCAKSATPLARQSGMIDALAQAAPDLELQSTAVMVADNKTNHLAGSHKSKSAQVWPSDWLDSLPEHFRNYRAVLWDKRSGALVVVPQDSFNSTAVPKIVIRPNHLKKQGGAASVVSLGSAPIGNFSNTDDYELLLGSLK